MKKLLPFLLAALLLAGCGAERSAPAEAEEDAVAAILLDTAQENADMMTARVGAGPQSPMEEEILNAYDRAVEACEWMELSPLPDTGETVKADGRIYRRVDARGLEKMEDLRIYLRGLFAPELAERLLEADGDDPLLYREIDGGLYVTGRGRTRDPRKGAVQVQIEQQTETRCAVHVTVDLLDEDLRTVIGLESWSFPYEYIEDRWVFTDFSLVD